MKKTLLSVLALGLGLSSVQAQEVSTIKERFFTDRNHTENVDSPAIWHGANGQDWLIVTAKATNRLLVHDAQNGALIRVVGGLGTHPGQFDRPNGIWVIDDFVFVVERDNRRVQVLHLPDFSSVGSFGQDELQKPYGLSVIKDDDSSLYTAYVTDNYETAAGDKPVAGELNHRVQVYQVELQGFAEDTMDFDSTYAFGDTEGEGILNIVESIYADTAHERLMVADEEETAAGHCIKVYDLEGRFTGTTLGKGLFHGQAEGIALWPTGETSGYWVFTDQDKQENDYHVFDRESLEYLGSFKGETTLNTDGVWLDPTPSERFPEGLFYAVHNDGNVAAFSLADIRVALDLK